MNYTRFSFFYKGVGIQTVDGVHEFDTLEEVKDEGLELVANKCIDLIKESINVDLRAITYPNDCLEHCSFIQLSYDNITNETAEKMKLKVKE